MFYKKSIKFMVLIVLVLALSGFTFAFAAANIVPDTKAGDGTGDISGYTVSNIHYVLDGTNPSTIDSVTFELSSTAVAVQAKVGPLGAWSSACTLSGAVWTCGFTTPPAVTTATSLQVVAAD
jgi:hypothetical protein